MNLNLAVLIDGDNIPSAYVKEMMEEIAKYGNPTIKRIYGDWTNPNLSKWKNLLLENAITPIQQYGFHLRYIFEDLLSNSGNVYYQDQ